MNNGLSVIIPTCKEIRYVKKLLTNLKDERSKFSHPTEVLIIDDSPEPCRSKLQQICKKYNAIYINGPAKVGRKRNLGAQKSKYNYILFLDSDCNIKRGILKEHYRILSDKTFPNCAGCLGLVIFVGRKTFAWKVISEMKLLLPFEYPRKNRIVQWGPTANISFHKNKFLEVGGFDLTLGYPKIGGEDVDLGFRLTKKGYEIYTNKNAVATHTIETWNSWSKNIRRLWSYGKADYFLMTKHSDSIFIDIPTSLVLLFIQLFVAILLAIFINKWIILFFPFISLFFSHFSYAISKCLQSKNIKKTFTYFVCPVIFYIMDVAKAKECIKHKKFGLIFKRVKFLGKQFSLDWDELVASSWSNSIGVFIFILLALYSSL